MDFVNLIKFCDQCNGVCFGIFLFVVHPPRDRAEIPCLNPVNFHIAFILLGPVVRPRVSPGRVDLPKCYIFVVDSAHETFGV